jgi:hypothetical protein
VISKVQISVERRICPERKDQVSGLRSEVSGTTTTAGPENKNLKSEICNQANQNKQGKIAAQDPIPET